jgi:lysophospholipase L1-like esterase
VTQIRAANIRGSIKPAARRIAIAGAIGTIALLVGFTLVEAGYRLVLLRTDPRLMLPWRLANPATMPSIEAYNRSLWQFDADEGYRYVQENVDWTRIEGGIVTGCARLNPINAHGGSGLIEGDYASADLRIAVFGDSFTWFSSPENLTWTNYLQRNLQRLTGRSTHVLNFARDGIGVMRMFDLAATRLPKYRPDFAIFALTTNAGMRPGRIWRFETVVDGEPRVFTADTPTRTTDPALAYDTFILHPRATLEWCQAAKGASHPIALEIVNKYMRLRATRYSASDLSRSFLLNKIVTKDPFKSSKAIDRVSSAAAERPFSHDARFLDAVAAVKRTGIPYLLVHLPYAPEVASGKEFLPDDETSQMERSDLQNVTGHPVLGLLENLDMPIERPERMNHAPDNLHPSPWGMMMTATGVVRVLLRQGLVSPRS